VRAAEPFSALRGMARAMLLQLACSPKPGRPDADSQTRTRLRCARHLRIRLLRGWRRGPRSPGRWHGFGGKRKWRGGQSRQQQWRRC
jgi:hypothetical protein